MVPTVGQISGLWRGGGGRRLLLGCGLNEQLAGPQCLVDSLGKTLWWGSGALWVVRFLRFLLRRSGLLSRWLALGMGRGLMVGNLWRMGCGALAKLALVGKVGLLSQHLRVGLVFWITGGLAGMVLWWGTNRGR